MSIQPIKSPWIRRPLLCLVFLPFTVGVVLEGAIRGAWTDLLDYFHTFASAWRGR